LVRQFCLKLVAMAMSLEGHIDHLQLNTYRMVKKIMKIGQIDPQIIGLQEIIKKERY